MHPTLPHAHILMTSPYRITQWNAWKSDSFVHLPANHTCKWIVVCGWFVLSCTHDNRFSSRSNTPGHTHFAPFPNISSWSLCSLWPGTWFCCGPLLSSRNGTRQRRCHCKECSHCTPFRERTFWCLKLDKAVTRTCTCRGGQKKKIWIEIYQTISIGIDMNVDCGRQSTGIALTAS